MKPEIDHVSGDVPPELRADNPGLCPGAARRA
jgi:hypothetical protein